MEPIEVIDTAVKVGLGALISGITTYLVTYANHNSDKKKEKSKRTHEALINITEKMESYFECLSRCIANVDGLIKSGVSPGTFPDKHFAVYRKADELLVDARKEFSSAYSRLRLIGEDQAARCISVLHDFENRFRMKLVFDRLLPTQAELDATRAELTIIKDGIFKELNAAYKRSL